MCIRDRDLRKSREISHACRRAKPASDPVKSLFVQWIVFCFFPEKIQPHVKGSPVLDRGSPYLVSNRGIFPDVLAVGPDLAFIFSLPDECETTVLIVLFDDLCDRPELADFAAPSCFHSGRADIIYCFSEFQTSISEQDIKFR